MMDIADFLNSAKTFTKDVGSWQELAASLVPQLQDIYNIFQQLADENRKKAEHCHQIEIANRVMGFFDAADFWRQHADYYDSGTAYLSVTKEFWLHLLKCNERVYRANGRFDSADLYRQLVEYNDSEGRHHPPIYDYDS